MEIRITGHARERMRRYDITASMIENALNDPDAVVSSYGGRKIYQKKLNDHVLRVITEEHKNIKTVITTYKARSVRYEI